VGGKVVQGLNILSIYGIGILFADLQAKANYLPSNCGNVLELFDSKNFDASLLVAERELNLARLWDGKNHDGSPLTVFPSGWKGELNLGTSPGIVSCETEPVNTSLPKS